MFICQQCRRQSDPREPATRVVVDTRNKVYLNHLGEVVGRGTEIVREMIIGTCCAKPPVAPAPMVSVGYRSGIELELTSPSSIH